MDDHIQKAAHRRPQDCRQRQKQARMAYEDLIKGHENIGGVDRHIQRPIVRGEPLRGLRSFEAAEVNNRRDGRTAALHHCGQLEDGKIHGYNEAPDERAQNADDNGLDEAAQSIDGIVDLLLVEVGHLRQHIL